MVATVVGALALIGLAVFGANDRETFVPVPENVAESFTREITTRRFDLARRYLAADARRRETARTLETRFAPLLAAAGTINHVDAQPDWRQDDRAGATASVEGDRGSVSLGYGLVREGGLWKISTLPDVR